MEKALYISVDLDDYKKNKSNALRAQAEILKSVKRLHNLKYLYSQEAKLKKRLHKAFETITVSIERIEKEFPDGKLPKAIKEKIEPFEEKVTNQNQEFEKKKIRKELDEKQSSIDLELQEIQEKLRVLNNS